MEYFTRNAYESSKTTKGRRHWEQLEKDYDAHLRSIHPTLGDGWRQLSILDLEGQRLLSAERTSFDQVVLELGSSVLVFHGVRIVRLPEPSSSDNGSEWIRHEIHQAEDDLFQLKVLLADGEVRVTADSLEIQRSAPSSRRIAA